MLLYGERIGELVRAVMPPGDGTPEDDFPTRVQRAVARLRARPAAVQPGHGHRRRASACTSSACSGSSPTARRYALAFGAFFGLMELIPYVGPFLGALPPVLVALFQDPLTAVWVALLFVALQQIEGHVVAPLVFGHALRINPLLVIFALLLGGELYGIVGALSRCRSPAVLRETVVYLRQHRCSSRGGRRARSRSSARRTGARRAGLLGVRRAGGAARRLLPALRGGPHAVRARASGARGR